MYRKQLVFVFNIKLVKCRERALETSKLSVDTGHSCSSRSVGVTLKSELARQLEQISAASAAKDVA